MLKLFVCLIVVLNCFVLGNYVSVEMFSNIQSYQGSQWPGFLISVDFGTPSQRVNLIVDGGLDLMYLFTPNCTEQGCGLSYFYPDDSSTLTYENIPFNYTYAAGNLIVDGEIVVDDGNVEGYPDKSQAFALVNNLSQPRYYPPSDPIISGVFGFAYPSSTYGQLSLLTNFAEQNNLNRIASMWLSKDIYENGWMTVGDINPLFYNGTMNYIPLLDSSWANKDYPFFWSNIITDIKVNGVSNGYCQRKTCNFFLDLAARPMDLANAIPSIDINSDCSNIDSLDTYTFTIGGIDYTLTPEDYIIQAVDGNSTICESGIFGGSKIPYPFTLGYTWIKNFYTVFDFDNMQIGFAPASNYIN